MRSNVLFYVGLERAKSEKKSRFNFAAEKIRRDHKIIIRSVNLRRRHLIISEPSRASEDSL